jgi:serine/threonine-protein kinase
LRPAAIGAAGLAATALVASAYQRDSFERLELDTIDARFALRGDRRPPRDLAIVQVDDVTFAELGVQWPFPRGLHARVISRISADRPRVIAYDVQFTEPTTAEEDNSLIEAVRSTRGRVVLATSEVDERGGTNVFGGDDVLRRIDARAGNSALVPDSDGVLRRIPHSIDDLETFALVAAEIASADEIPPSALGGPNAWIDFHGAPGTIPAISFSRVLNDDVDPGFFAGRVVVVGASAPSLQDVHSTATGRGELMSGPEVQANAISTALAGFPLRDDSQGIDLAAIAFLGLLVPAATLRWGYARAVAFGAAAGVGFLAAAIGAFELGRVVTLVYPLAALLASAVATLASLYAFEVVGSRATRRRAGGGIAIGEDFAGYLPERLLGRGGGGTVYLATEVALRRKVALKVLNPQFAESEPFRQQFLRESQIAAALDHAHVVPIFRAGAEGRCLYIAMKYVRGSLAALLARDQMLDLARAVAIVEQVSDALDAAHARSLVHRDVTPGNILLDPRVTPDGPDYAYLADFGLSRHPGLRDEYERVGKPDYMAPEQIRGESIDGRADLYSLGCILYECLVGEPPFRSASEITVIGGHLSQPPPSATARRTGIPPAIDTVIARALAKEPAERYDTCGELAAAAKAAHASASRASSVDRKPQ